MIIAMTGAAGSGKDAVADILVKDYGFERLSFAYGLKSMLRRLYEVQHVSAEVIERKIEGDLKEKSCHYLSGKSPRHAMQALGTEWGRNCIGESFWVQAAVESMEREIDYVCSDCRFENEWDALKLRGAYMWRRTGGGLDGDAALHESEHGLSNVEPDVIIPRYEDMNMLREAVSAHHGKAYVESYEVV